MNHPMSPSDELEILLSVLCDGQIREEQLVRLNEILRSSDELRRRYVHYMGLHTALQGRIAESDPVRSPGIPSLPGSPVGHSERNRASAPPSTTPATGTATPPARARLSRLVAIAAVLLGLIFVTRTWWPWRGSPLGHPAGSTIVARGTEQSAPRIAESGASALDEPDRTVPESKERQAGKGGRGIAVLTRVVDPEWGPTELPTEVGSACRWAG